MIKIGIIVGSTRPGRKAEAVAQWVLENAKAYRNDINFEIVDIKDYNLPLLDEAVPASYQNYQNEHTKRWAAKIGELDGFIFVTPEYNHAPSGALKNAIDFLFAEWNNKAAGFVSYGSAMGVRAVEHLKLIMCELMVANVRTQVMLSLFTDFENFSKLTPAPYQIDSLKPMIDQLASWTEALKVLREK